MKSRTVPEFWNCYDRLPNRVKERAVRAYALFSENPHHPSLKFKRIRSLHAVCSVRLADNYRALGYLDGDEVTWVWVGTHVEYEAAIKRLKTRRRY